MIFIIGGREQGKTAYAMKLWEKRTLERRKTKDLSTVLNRSKNPEACRVTARIADGRLETDEQTIMQADLITHFELFVRREMEAGRDPYVFAERLMQENPDAFVTADEIGCGIVPMEAFERDYRGDRRAHLPADRRIFGGSAPGYLRSGNADQIKE